MYDYGYKIWCKITIQISKPGIRRMNKKIYSLVETYSKKQHRFLQELCDVDFESLLYIIENLGVSFL